MSYRRSVEEKKRLNALYEKTKNAYGAGAMIAHKGARNFHLISRMPRLDDARSLRFVFNRSLVKGPTLKSRSRYVWRTVDESKLRKVRYSCHNAFSRKQARRHARRMLKTSSVTGFRAYFKRCYDYWWEIL